MTRAALATTLALLSLSTLAATCQMGKAMNKKARYGIPSDGKRASSPKKMVKTSMSLIGRNTARFALPGERYGGRRVTHGESLAASEGGPLTQR